MSDSPDVKQQETPFDDFLHKNDPVDDLVKKSSKKIKKEKGWHFAKHGGLLPKINNILNIIKDDNNLKDLWRLNDFTGDIEYDRNTIWGGEEGQTLKDSDDVFLRGYLAEKYFFEPSKTDIRDSVFLASSKKRVHPIKYYLNNLKWDEKPRLDNWLSCATGADNNEYINLIGKKVLCAAVARIYTPGCKFDHMMILEGRQRTFKSTMIEVLGDPWYASINLIEDDKKAVDTMRGKWILEMEELAAMQRTDVEHAKAFLSRKTDRVRLSYGHRAEDFPRHSIIIGTLNPVGDNQYFKDQSGNTRFWPVMCKGKININWVKEHKDQLFAEAIQKWKNELLFLDDNKAIEIAEDEQSKRQLDDTWVDIIDTWLNGKDIVSPTDILTGALAIPKERILPSNIIRVGICMKRLHWEIRVLNHNLQRKKLYIRPGINVLDINNHLVGSWDEEELIK